MNTNRKLTNSFSALLAALALSFVSQAALAGPIVIGNDPVDREHSDSWSNFVLSLTTEVFPINGYVTDWSVWAASEGTMALLILDDGLIVGADYAKVTTGFNTFAFNADSGTSLVSPGFNVGLWLGSATIDFSRGDAAGGDTVQWCLSDGCAMDAPAAGDSFTFSGSGTNTFRQYSVSVIDPPVGENAEVPEPETLLLFGLGLAIVGWTRKAKIIKS